MLSQEFSKQKIEIQIKREIAFHRVEQNSRRSQKLLDSYGKAVAPFLKP